MLRPPLAAAISALSASRFQNDSLVSSGTPLNLFDLIYFFFAFSQSKGLNTHQVIFGFPPLIDFPSRIRYNPYNPLLISLLSKP